MESPHENRENGVPINKEDETLKSDNRSASGNDSEKARRFMEVIQNIDLGSGFENAATSLSEDFLSILGGQSIFIFEYNRDKELYIPSIVVGESSDIIKSFSYTGGEGVLGRVVESGQPELVCEADEICGDVILSELSRTLQFSAYICSPISLDDGRKGIVCILGNKGEASFQELQFEYFKTFTRIIELLCNYDLVKGELKEKSARLDQNEFDLYTVYQVSKNLSSILDAEKLTSLIADMLMEIITVEHVHIYLLDETEAQLNAVAYKYLDPWRSCPFLSIKTTEKLTDWVARQVSGIQIFDDFSDPSFEAAFPNARDIFEQLEVKLMIPMVHKYKLVGFLTLGKKYVGNSFCKRDHVFLSTVAPLAANAISNALLYEMAILDGLTRVFLGRYFQQRCKEELKRASRYNKVLSLVMWDIDHFKTVNDTYGHLVGDIVLKELTTIFKKNHRQGVDLIGRYGGEEFVLLLPDTSREGSRIMAERLRRKVEDFGFCDGKISITISGGIACYPEDGTTYTELVQQADMYLYASKRGGRNRVSTMGFNDCSILPDEEGDGLYSM